MKYQTVILFALSKLCKCDGSQRMRCPVCHSDDDRVIDSRPNKDNTAIRRRRMCNACNKRFTTYEYIEEYPLQVVKKDGRREDFSREKILNGLAIACRKRNIPRERIERLVDEVFEQLIRTGIPEVSSSTVGQHIMEKLCDIDPVAWVRFASVYREFNDVDEFKRTIDGLQTSKDEPRQQSLPE